MVIVLVLSLFAVALSFIVLVLTITHSNLLLLFFPLLFLFLLLHSHTCYSCSFPCTIVKLIALDTKLIFSLSAAQITKRKRQSRFSLDKSAQMITFCDLRKLEKIKCDKCSVMCKNYIQNHVLERQSIGKFLQFLYYFFTTRLNSWLRISGKLHKIMHKPYCYDIIIMKVQKVR